MLDNATITGNQSLFEDRTNFQVGAVYIHNGNRSVTFSGDTVIEGNTDIDGNIADLYLQNKVRKTDPSRYPEPLHMYVGQLTENASINLCPGLGYEYSWFEDDLNDLPLLTLDSSADPEVWNNRWIRVDAQDDSIIYDPVSQSFVCVRNTES